MSRRKNLIGKKFGRLLVLKEAERVRGYYAWECQCDCGNITIKPGSDLTKGRTKSCGCLRKEGRSRYKDLSGIKFSRLTVISESKERIRGIVTWKCLCDCGNIKNVCTSDLKLGNTRSCGCLSKELRIKNRHRDKTKQKPETIKKANDKYVGKRYGLITILELDSINADGRRIWKYKCDCGNIKTANENKFYTKRKIPIQDCGCRVFNLTGFGDITGAFFSSIKHCAKQRNLEFNITPEYLWNLYLKQNGKCALTGISIRPSRRKDATNTASVDRIDSDIGYIEGNVQWVHKYVNILKHSLSVKDFVGLCSMVIKYFDENYIPNDKFSVDIDNLDVMRLKRGGRFPERDRKK